METTREVRVETFAQLQEELFADSWNPTLKRFRSQYAFRGLSDARYDLTTTLMRLGGSYEEMEAHLLRNFRKYAHRNATPGDSVWHWLSLAQHHGLPTRILDWTYSPYVAMHFATANIERFHLDGVIWAVHYGLAHEALPAPLRVELDREGSDVFTVDMLSSVVATLPELARLATAPFLLFFEPPSLDDRLINQFALCSLLSRPSHRLAQWIAERPALARRIVIPAALKWEVRDKLDQANVTERVLFPGLDGLSRWLARHYAPRAGD